MGNSEIGRLHQGTLKLHPEVLYKHYPPAAYVGIIRDLENPEVRAAAAELHLGRVFWVVEPPSNRGLGFRDYYTLKT